MAEPSRRALGCRRAPTVVHDGDSHHGRGRVGTDEPEPSRRALGYRKAPTAVRAGDSQHGRSRVGMVDCHALCGVWGGSPTKEGANAPD